MLELDVVLDFACCYCGHDMGVTLKCEGKGLADNLDIVIDIKVPCLTCGNENKVYFSPSGTLHYVAPVKRKVPEPSCN